MVPTDFSNNANNAVEFAKRIALLDNGNLTLIYSFNSSYDFAAQAAKIILKLEENVFAAMEEIKKTQNHIIPIIFRLWNMIGNPINISIFSNNPIN